MKLPTPAHMGWTPPSWAPAAAADAARGALCGLLLLGSTAVVTVPDSALAAPYKTDGAAIGKCLLKSCQKPLARCVTDPTCAANLVCIQTCAANPETEAECQIKCGDEFSNDVVADLTKCAVSDKSCVPQRPDDGSWPTPRSIAACRPRTQPSRMAAMAYSSRLARVLAHQKSSLQNTRKRASATAAA